MTDEKLELAWAAGFFDGEGSTLSFLSRSGRYAYPRFVLSIGQSGSDYVLQRFRKAVGGVGFITGPYKYGERQMPRWNYRIEGTGALKVLMRIRHFLSPTKRKQAIAAIRKHKGR